MNDTLLIKKVLLAFEQSATTIQYGKVYRFNDGPGNIKQITLSFGTTEYGNLSTIVRRYVAKGGRVADRLKPYVEKIGKVALADDERFIKLLQEAGDDVAMQLIQDAAYDEMYIQPAMRWCEKNKLILPLSKLVVADSFLQSGSILSSLRNKFSAKIPSVGGDERKWIESYCIVRKDWLANHSRKILNKTVYRVNFMLDCIEAGDWNLAQPEYRANGVKIVNV